MDATLTDSEPFVLLTGATGLVGRYLLRDLPRAGVRLAVVARGQGSQPAVGRIADILAFWQSGDAATPVVVCLDGDITQPGLGLSDDARRWVARHCRAVLHNAASLTFVEPDRDRDPWRSNLTGTRHVLALCREVGLRQFHHVSTAYVCGTRDEPVLEDDLDRGQSFRNDYEQSKLEAELAVRAAGFLDPPTVYRPAIIVGDSVTGYTSTYHGLYPYLRFIATIVQALPPQEDGRRHIPFRINLTGHEHRNLVPVDWVSAIITHLLTHPEHHGRTYHLTPTRPVTAAEIEQATASYFNYYGPAFAGGDALTGAALSDLESLFYQAVATYQPYWSREPTFDCRNTLAATGHLACPAIDGACLHRLIDFARQDAWGKRRRTAC